jgi:hypothetical protein
MPLELTAKGSPVIGLFTLNEGWGRAFRRGNSAYRWADLGVGCNGSYIQENEGGIL